MKQYYQIGNHPMAVSGNRLCTMLATMQAFRPFSTPEADREAFLFVETGDEAPAFERIIYQLTDLGTTFRFGIVPGGYRMSETQDGGRQMDLWTTGEGPMYMSGNDWDPLMVRSLLWTGYGLQTAAADTITIHSSCIVCHGQAILCLGESGTGKSTHTRLWRQHIEGSHLLNDDSPILRVEEDEVWVYGSPWSGKTPCYRSERYPLKACIRLSQAPHNHIRRLSVVQAYAALHPSCPPAFAYDGPLYDGISHTLDQVLQRVPCYHLACLPDQEAAQLAHHTLFAP